ncbi:MAG: cell division protein FtsZ [Beijerinckiaceae bacterium]
MTINLQAPDIRELKPRITVFGVGGAGGNAVNNMIECGLQGVEFVISNTDAQALGHSKAERVIQMGLAVTEGLGAGAQPEVGRAAAEEVIDEIRDQLMGAHMVFITAGMGGGTGAGAAPVIARVAREMGILTVGVVTKPFQFEGLRRMRVCESGITELQKHVDTLIVIPNQNLFRVANEKTTFAEAFAMADQVLYSGVASITDLMVKPGLINLDFADVRAVMREMGKAMMGTGEATGDKRALMAAEAAIANPLLDEVSMKGAKGLLISITGGKDMMLYELDEAATRIREEVDPEANIILGATQDDSLDGIIRVSVVATGIDRASIDAIEPVNFTEQRIAEVAQRLRSQIAAKAVIEPVMPLVRASAPVLEAAEPVAKHEELPEESLVPFHAEAFASQPETIGAETPRFMPAPPEEAIAARVPEPAQIFAPEAASMPVQPSLPAPVRSEDQIVRPVRLPQIEDFPMVAQAQMRAAQTPVPVAPPAAEIKRMTLLQRLAAVGLGRRDEHEHDAPVAPTTPVAPVSPPPVSESVRRPTVQPPLRSAQGQLDSHGRAQPRSMEDDQLEIPAFLRRQAH